MTKNNLIHASSCPLLSVLVFLLCILGSSSLFAGYDSATYDVATTDTDGDGVMDGIDIDDDNDGVVDDLECPMRTYPLRCDNDGDSIPDHLDLDSDGDGIPDNIEAQTTVGYTPPPAWADGDGDGLHDIYDADDTDRASTASVGLIPVDTDGDSTENRPDYLDLDSDNDGGFDLVESGLVVVDANADGKADGVVGANGWDDTLDTADDYSGPNGRLDTPTTDLKDTDGDVSGNVPLVQDLDYRDADNDVDRDGIPSSVDIDDDNDGILDVEESYWCVSAGTNFVGPDYFSNVTLSNVSPAKVYMPSQQPLEDYWIDGDIATGRNSFSWTDTAQPVRWEFELHVPLSADGLSVANDYGQVGAGDGIREALVYLYDDADSLIGTESFPNLLNNDSTGIDNYDFSRLYKGIARFVIEMPWTGAGTGPAKPAFQVREIGLFTRRDTCLPRDSDSDGVADSLDLDSDNDGIPDNTEAQTAKDYIAPDPTDIDGNGLYDVYETSPGSGEGLTPVDTDGDSAENLPDYLDLDSDNDGVFDLVESGLTVVDANTDGKTDGVVGINGWDDTLDNDDYYGDPNWWFSMPTTDLKDDDVTRVGPPIPDSYDRDPTIDSDGDGLFDSQDIDDDNDGILDVDESYQCVPAGTNFIGPNYFSNVTLSNVSPVTIYVSSQQPLEDYWIDGDIATGRNSFSWTDTTQPVRLEFELNAPLSVDGLSVANDFGTVGTGDGIREAVVYLYDDAGSLLGTESFPSLLNNSSTGIDNYNLSQFYEDVARFVIEMPWTGPGTGPARPAFQVREVGLFTSRDTCLPRDSDGDGVSDSLDLDSDNDGIPDNIEAQTTKDYIAPNPTDSDGNGLYDVYETSAGSGEGLTPVDTDGDSTSDYLDLDSDNDNVFDLVESGLTVIDANTDGKTDGVVGANGWDNTLETADDYSDPNGNLDTPTTDLKDTDGDVVKAVPLTHDLDYRDAVVNTDRDSDGDGLFDSQDIDDDNDGILDVDESYQCVPAGTNFIGPNYFSNVTLSNVSPVTIYVSSQQPLEDYWIDGDIATGRNSFSWTDTTQPVRLEFELNAPLSVDGLSVANDFGTVGTGDGIREAVVYLYDDAGSLLGTESFPSLLNSSSTGIDNYNLSKFYKDVARFVIEMPWTGPGTGPAAPAFQVREVGLFTSRDTCLPRDSDGDGVSDSLDLDSDNDGIPDNIEAQTTKDYIAPDPTDSDGNGLYDVYETSAGSGEGLTPVDTDGDSTSDYLDLDSDNDNAFDLVESGLTVIDANTDGKTDGVVGANGWDNTLETADDYSDPNGNLDTPTTDLKDTDGDVVKAVPLTHDLDYRDTVVNTDRDSDGDGLFDSQDIDDDNDGILDVDESYQCVPAGTNFIGPNYFSNVTLSNVSPVTIYVPSQQPLEDYWIDGDIATGRNSFSWTDTTQPVRLEFELHAPLSVDGLSVANDFGTVGSGDGIREAVVYLYDDAGSLLGTESFPNLLNNSSTGIDNYNLSQFYEDVARFVIEMPWTGPGTGPAAPAFQVREVGLFTSRDTCLLRDSDGDGIADSLDLDSDNDGIPDNIEAQTTKGYIAPDPTDSDGNGLYDVYEASAGSGEGLTPVDTDGDSTENLPDYLDLDSDNDGSFDLVESGLTVIDVNADGKTDGVVGDNGWDDTLDTTDDYSDPNGNLDTPTTDLKDTDGDVAKAVPLTHDLDYRDAVVNTGKDSDGDGLFDSQDIDDDNDGILDVDESYQCVPAGTNFIGPNYFSNVTLSNVSPVTIYVSSQQPLEDYWIDGDIATGRNSFSWTDTTQPVRLEFELHAPLSVDGLSVANDFGTVGSGDGIREAVVYLYDDAGSLLGTESFPNLLNNSSTGIDNYNLSQFYEDVARFVIEMPWTGPGTGPAAPAFQVREVGLFTSRDTCLLRDSDGDGIADSLDLDSDNDGIPDNIEAQTTKDYIAPDPTDSDGNGLYDVYEASAGSGEGLTPVDTDGDSTENLPDYLDLDSDNDGSFDLVESGLTVIDVNADGKTDGVVGDNGWDDTLDTTDDYSDPNGNLDTPTTDLKDTDGDVAKAVPLTHDLDYRDAVVNTGKDSDGDGLFDSQDIDDDNDGILDVDESYQCVPAGTNFIGPNYFSNVTLSNVSPVTIYVSSQQPLEDYWIDGDIATGRNSFSWTDTTQPVRLEFELHAPLSVDGLSVANDFGTVGSGDGIREAVVYLYDDAGSLLGTESFPNLLNNSSTGIDNYNLSQFYEDVARFVIEMPWTGPGTGPAAPAFQVREVGLFTSRDTCLLRDSDGDGIADSLDLDSDNDGIPDNIEAQTTKGYIAPDPTDSDGNGLYDVYEASAGSGEGLTPVDTDGDSTENLPDYLDLDSDNDGSFDLVESGLTVIDVNADGKTDGVVGDNGWDNTLETADDYSDPNGNLDTPTTDLKDTDGDVAKAVPLTHDLDYRDTVVNTDSDGDGISDSQDIDDDNDGILDTVESGTCGIVSPDSVTSTATNQGTITLRLLANTRDGDIGYNSYGGGELRVVEINGDVIYRYDTLQANVSEFRFYSNGGSDLSDGQVREIDTVEFLGDNGGVLYSVSYFVIPTAGSVANYEGISFPIPLDGVRSIRLAGIRDTLTSSKAEAVWREVQLDGCPFKDSDGDGLADSLDLDSDNDGIPDNIEAQTSVGYIAPVTTDSDGNGLYDVYEITPGAGVGLTPVDTDSDGTTDQLDLDSDNDERFDLVESGLTVIDTDMDGQTDSPVGANGWDDTLETADDYIDPNGSLDTPATQLTDVDNDVSGNEPLVRDLDYRDTQVDVVSDLDGDGIPDAIDIDDDNDGILDTVESGTCGIVSPDSVTSTATNQGTITLRLLANTRDGDIGYNSYGGGEYQVVEINGDVIYRYNTLRVGVSEFRFYSNGGSDLSDGQVREIDTVEFLGDNGGVLYSVSDFVIPTAGSVANYEGISFPIPLDGVRSIRLAGIRDTLTNNKAEAVWREVQLDGCPFKDSDGDGLADSLDLDSDNDGIPDNIEAQTTKDYIAPDPTDSDGNGLYDVYETSAGSGEGLTPVDTDGDSTSDYLDLDSDNDNVFDLVESGLTVVDANTDGKTDSVVGANGWDDTLDTTDDYSDPNGDLDTPTTDLADTDGDVAKAVPLTHDLDYRDAVVNTDSDGDGLFDSQDIDDDNDGILDVDESYQCVPAGTNFIGPNYFSNVTLSNVSPVTIYVSSQQPLEDYWIDGDIATGRNSFSWTDTTQPIRLEFELHAPLSVDGLSVANDFGQVGAGDGIREAVVYLYDDAGGLLGTESFPNLLNNSSTGIDNYNLSQFYKDVARFVIEMPWTGPGTGPARPAFQMREVGLFTSRDTCLPRDSDGDGIADSLDLDSDNDGIPDNIEAQTTKDYIAPDPTDSDGNGLYDVYEASAGSGEGLTPVDTDGDSTSDYLDLDSDNDNVFDLVESGLTVIDANTDGKTDGVVGVNGWDDTLDTTDDYSDPNGDLDTPTTDLKDTDGDVAKAVPLTYDLDYRDAVVNVDSDGDGLYDEDDIDDDNDGILDTVESEACGIVSPDSVTSTATNQGAIPLRLLANTRDGDIGYNSYGGGEYQVVEINGDVIYRYNTLRVGVSEFRFYSNGGSDLSDGQVREIDTVEFLGDNGGVLYSVSDFVIPTAGSVANYEGISFPIPLQGVRSIRLAGIRDTLTNNKAEAVWREVQLDGCPFKDSDGDGLADSFDLDSDNDGIPDNIEAQTSASYIIPLGRDDDKNGMDDAYDPSNGLTPVDTDSDGTVDYLDLDSDEDGLTDLEESGLGLSGDAQGRTTGTVGLNGWDDRLEDAANKDNYLDVNGKIDDPSNGSMSLIDLDDDVSGAVLMTEDLDYRDTDVVLGYTVSGYVFEDSNVSGILDSNESGIAGVTIVLHDTVNNACRSVKSGAEGYYYFEYVENSDYTLYEAANETVIAPANCPPTLVDPTDYGSSTSNQRSLTVLDADMSNQNFGDVRAPRFELDHQKTAAPHTLVTHPHVFTTPVAGSVSFSIAEQMADPANLPWGTGLMQDVNCDAQLDGNDIPLVNPHVVSAGDQVCLLVKVITPANATNGALHTMIVQSDFAFAGSSGLANITQQHTDLTRVIGPSAADLHGGIGQLVLTKSVWNMTRGIDGTVALPGEELLYTIAYENIGTGPLNELIIHDSVPEFTKLVTDSLLCTDKPAELPLCAVNDDVNGSLHWKWSSANELQTGSKGSVSYRVTVE